MRSLWEVISTANLKTPHPFLLFFPSCNYSCCQGRISRLFTLCFCLLTATFNSGLHDAQTGDCRVSEKIQCQKKAQGKFSYLKNWKS